MEIKISDMRKLTITASIIFFVNILCYSQVDTSEYNKYVREQQQEFQDYKDKVAQEYKDFINDEKDWIKLTTGKDVDVEVVREENSTGTDKPNYVVEVKEDIVAKDNAIEKEEIISYIFPLKDNFRVSSKFGYRIHPVNKIKKFHYGVDLACSKGTAIYAVADGKITRSNFANGYGNFIIIRHNNGIVTAYGHLNNSNVEKGQLVKKGDVIGYVGSTGRSTGPHLHFEVIKNSKKVNPANIFASLKK